MGEGVTGTEPVTPGLEIGGAGTGAAVLAVTLVMFEVAFGAADALTVGTLCCVAMVALTSCIARVTGLLIAFDNLAASTGGGATFKPAFFFGWSKDVAKDTGGWVAAGVLDFLSAGKAFYGKIQSIHFI